MKPTAAAGAALWLWASVGVAGPSQPEAALRPFQASYSWSWHGATVAVSTLQLQHASGDDWTYSSNTAPRGLGHLYPMRPSLRSTLRITSQGVQPLTFKAAGSGSAHDADVTFDWGAGRATGNYEGTALDLTLQPGVQDDLSVQIALMVELLHDRTPEHLAMLDRNRIRDYRYQREGSESLVTPIGQVDTIIYSSQHPGSPRITRFWCAPSRGYIPMRVEQKRQDNVEWTMNILTLQRD
ncbi:MAG TPA: DUF3108 domain-containing protein [Steroidobacteraceae bacterium]|jgi:hypothetical protein